MTLRFVARTPRPPLDQLVELIWASEGQPQAQLEEVAPFGKAQILVDLDRDRLQWVRRAEDRLWLSGTVLQGPLTRPLLVDARDQRKLLGASLQPWGLAAFLRPPVHELRDQLMELRELTSVELGPAVARLASTAWGPARLDAFEAVLRDLLSASAGRVAPHLRRAAARLDAAGDLGVQALARELGVSRRRLSEQFSAVFGMRPKTWQRVRRFRRSVTLLDAGRSATEVAHGLGYTDQPHFNREFREFSGRSPLEYVRSPRSYPGHIVVR